VTLKNFSVTRGDNWTLTGEFLVSGVAQDMTGYIWFITVKNLDDNETDDDDALVEYNKTVASGTSTTLTPDTTSLIVGKYKYDVQVKTSAGAVYTLVQGLLTITDDVTKRNTTT
jgi:azurin